MATVPSVFYPVEKPVRDPLLGQGEERPEKVIYTRGLWASGTGELFTFFTSSVQNTASKEYYYQVWGSASNDCTDVEEFSVAYAHISGSGSLSQGGEAGDTATRAIFSQQKLLCLEPNISGFTLGDGTVMNHFYVINFNRNKVGDKLDPGNFQLSIAQLAGTGFANNVFTGSNVTVSSSNKIITLIDDSGDASDNLGFGGIPSPVRNLVSGTIDLGIHNSTAPNYYGLVYADLGIILISADKLNQSASFNTVTGSNIAGDNAMKLFKSISGSGALGSGFKARSVEVKEQDFYFVRIQNAYFNYSNNPTYISSSFDSTGKQVSSTVRNKKFVNEPATYITSIGLYDQEGGNLLAIAKLSKPIQKNFNSELSITVKLEY